MSIVLRCQCGKVINVAEKHVGMTIECRLCGRTIVVPAVHRSAPVSRRIARWIRRRRQAKRLSVRPRSIFAPGRREVIFGYVAWATCAANCLLAVLMWRYGDVWWPMTALLFMGRWIPMLRDANAEF